MRYNILDFLRSQITMRQNWEKGFQYALIFLWYSYAICWNSSFQLILLFFFYQQSLALHKMEYSYFGEGLTLIGERFVNDIFFRLTISHLLLDSFLPNFLKLSELFEI